MNRAERRKQKDNKKPAVRMMTDDQIEQIKRAATDAAVDKMFVLMMGIPLLVLRDKHGFGKFRLGKFADNCYSWYKSVRDGDVGLEEIIKVLEEEAGYKLIKKRICP